MDITAELDAFQNHMLETGMSDRDALDELFEKGYTLEDLKEYRQDTYEWALGILNEE
jgi:hypothetical protein